MILCGNEGLQKAKLSSHEDDLRETEEREILWKKPLRQTIFWK